MNNINRVVFIVSACFLVADLAACESAAGHSSSSSSSGGSTGQSSSSSSSGGTDGGAEFPPMTFITSDPGFTDYRPAIDGTGQVVVFERNTYPNPADAGTTLYVATSIGSPNPPTAVFLNVTASPDQTRPDWNWQTNQVAFTGAPSSNATPAAYIATADGGAVNVVPGTSGFIYPIWSTDGTQLVVDNNSAGATPAPPVTSEIRVSDGHVNQANLDGDDTATPPAAMFGGMAAPKPGQPFTIAFAGQPALASWVPGMPPPSMASYNQNYNYVFLNSAKADGGYESSPLEAGASMSTYDPAYQGRAPYWSPDGSYIVFESSRAGSGSNPCYALFLAHVAETPLPAPVQVTDCSYWAQHAKFSPDGTKLVFTALQTPNVNTDTDGPRGIAIIDISAYL